MTYGDGIHGMKHDGKFVHGKSEGNAVRAHQLRSGLHDGCYVSFSRSAEIATRFATNSGQAPGYVYVVGEALLAEHGVVQWEFPDAEYPDEIEVSLRAADNGDLPAAIILQKYRCDPIG